MEPEPEEDEEEEENDTGNTMFDRKVLSSVIDRPIVMSLLFRAIF